MNSTDALSYDNKISAGEGFLPHLKSGKRSWPCRNNTRTSGKNRQRPRSVNLSGHGCFYKRLKIEEHLCVQND